MGEKLRDFIDYLLFKIRAKNNVGTTTFAQLKIEPEYTNIDLEKKQVTGEVKYKENTYLTVIVDLQNNTTKVKGNLRRISKIIKPFKKRHYIEMIESEAEFLIDKPITNTKE
ncbi:hypothetical protein V7056_19855 [Bacillus sp. JJ664]